MSIYSTDSWTITITSDTANWINATYYIVSDYEEPRPKEEKFDFGDVRKMLEEEL